ncbi:glycoside hydrolase family 3 C-terminal domain-containing protein [Fusibacter ferrireducens]|uniref:Glycoside hydrolase family 3 C-terminal domain-containing protein n=1 Tax=Fusibacter ferrireducens TaxID=2785058 RepID=A0ABR9ZRT5_9FIRM|nr:glycoside hydrolase family 3 C-terminal domain-containing protein [Fusibacter ferrireducens]MBF4692344.1 glycoside hydrolase family 3 C-terminal domain-containing protein [Fusibacter ferrireducens]
MEKYQNTKLTPQERAEDIVSKMTLEEKVSQLRYDAFEIERLGLPAYNWWNESLHGVARAGTATMFPQAIGLAATFDENLIGNVGDICATEARAKYNASKKQGDCGIYKGLTMWSPNINIFRDPRWGRGQETYGECPYLTSRLGVRFAKGLQGDQPVLKVAACAKHYAGHSGPENVRHQFDAEINDKDLNETYLPAFEALVKEAQVESVMGAYNRLNHEPACASDYLMDKLKAWGFDGHFISDCWAIRDFHTHHKITSTPAESAALALNMGCDLNCGNTYQHLLEALEAGLVSEEVVTASAERLMRTRIRLGMLDETCAFDDIGYEQVSSEAHKAYSLECAQKSMVLLKNNGLLPLDQNKIDKIAVIGPNASSIEALRGNYYGTADEYWTFLDGIRNTFKGRIYYSEGSHLFSALLQPLAQPGDGYSEAVTAAQHSDVVILCVGLDATIEGEEGDTGNAFAAGDKVNLYLPKSQRKLVEQILALNKPTVIVNASGSAMNVLGDQADAIIQTWYPGQMGGKALADILFGTVSPSGKLPVTFYESTELLPDFEDYSMKNRTYRYVENNVLYPFGYGLTYSDVICKDLKFDLDSKTASFTVVNQGNYDTDEVVQLYIRCENSEHEVRNHKLCGFKRIHIKQDEVLELEIQISEKAFEVVNDAGVSFVDGNLFTLYVGVNQPDDLSEKLTGRKCSACQIEL